MFKPLAEMSGMELRAALDAAIEQERMAEFVDGLRDHMTVREGARRRQASLIDEMARRRARFRAEAGIRETRDV